MLNRVVLVGRLTKDVEIRYTNSQKSVAQFTVAVNRQFKSDGQTEADFINCVAWNKTAENTAQYVGKGSLIGVDGRIQTRSYDDSAGKRVFVTEVVADSVQFLEPKGAQKTNVENVDFSRAIPPANFGGSTQTMSNDFDPALDITDDDLPF